MNLFYRDLLIVLGIVLVAFAIQFSRTQTEIVPDVPSPHSVTTPVQPLITPNAAPDAKG